ncbi:hypothetical protein Tco_0072918 [Tanacetum coccineum]
MNPTTASQIALDNALLSSCYPAFLITTEVPEIYMHQFWNTVTKVKDSLSYQFKLDNKKFRVNAEVFREILQICLKLPDKPFDIPPSTDKEIDVKSSNSVGVYHCKNVDFVKLLWEDFAFQIDNHFSKESMPYPRFTKIIINHFILQNKSISMRNRINLHTARDDSLLGTLKYVSKTEEHQVYGALIPKEMLNEDILNSTAYETYFAYASGAKEPKMARKFKKHASPKLKTVPVSPKEPTKKPAKKTKTPAKGKRSKGIEIHSDVALTEAAQLKEVTKRIKKDFHISHASDSGDGTDFESGIPDEQQCKISGADKGTGTKPGVPDVPKYDSKSEKESWGDSGEDDDDDEDDSEDEDNDDNDDDDDGNDDDGDHDDNDDDSDHERTESDIDENLNLNQSNKEHEKEEEEYVDEFTHEEDNADNAKEENEEELDDAEELYRDVNVNLRKEDEEEDAHVTLTAVYDTKKTKGPMQSSSVSSDFTEKLLNFENASLADNEIASLMDTTVRHEEPSGQTSSLFTVPITVIPEIMSTFTTTIPPQHPFFNTLPQQATPTPTPTASEVTTSFPALPDFASVFRFNERVTNSEKDLSEMKQVDQYAQAISLIPAIVDRHINNKQREAIQQAIQSHIAECREETLADRREYINLIDTSVGAIIKEERNVIESLEAVVLGKSSSQPKSTYEVAASLSKFKLTKILMDKMEEHKSYLRADYKRKIYDVLVKSYNTKKDLFKIYGEVFTLKKRRDDKDKDQDPSDGSDRGTKRKKSSKDAESSRDPESKEFKSTRSSQGTSRSHHKSSGKYAHAEELSHIVDDSRVQQNQEFDTSNNDKQPDDEAVSNDDWYKKPEKPKMPDPDWNKRQQVDFRPSQTWISNMARAEKIPTSFDELMDTPIDFSAFVMNRLNITNLTQELLVGPTFNLLKGTCKSRMELEYHFEECFKAPTERLDWHNLKGKKYPFDLRKPLPLIPNHRGRHVIPFDYFINNDLEYLKGGSLSRKYSTSVTKTKAATYEGPKRQHFYGFVSNKVSAKDVYSRKRIIAVTSLKIMKWYDYCHLDEIEVRREDQQLYKFKEDERYDLNVALRMFTRRIFVQRRVEDLQLGIESYQKKLNLTKPGTFRQNLRNRTAYTAYSDPQGVIYEDQNNKNRLMRTGELHKFSDSTLNYVRTALHDITSGIRMVYMPKRKWRGLDKRRARVMIKDIDKQLFQRRIMRNLEKFVGGREYEEDLRLLERTI